MHQSITKHHAGEDCDPIHQPPPHPNPDSAPEGAEGVFRPSEGHQEESKHFFFPPKTFFKAWFDCRCGTKLRLHPITTGTSGNLVESADCYSERRQGTGSCCAGSVPGVLGAFNWNSSGISQHPEW